MRSFVMIALAASLLTVFVPNAHAGPTTGGCAQYPTNPGLQVAACNDGQGSWCVLLFYGGSIGYACAPVESVTGLVPEIPSSECVSTHPPGEQHARACATFEPEGGVTLCAYAWGSDVNAARCETVAP